MTNNNIHSKSDTISNITRTTNKIKLKINGGVLTGNIISDPLFLIPTCQSETLDFSCDNNSQYVPII